MVFFNEEFAKEIRQWTYKNIPEKFLTENGIEDEPHIRCQYGFHSSVSVEEIANFIDKNIVDSIELELGEISKFECPEYDVFKIDVNSLDLHKLSDKIREHFKGKLEIIYPNYHPHVTLGYVKKDSLSYIDGVKMFKGKKFKFNSFVYSTSGMKDKYDIKKYDQKIFFIKK